MEKPATSNRLLDLIWIRDSRISELSEEVQICQKEVVAKQGEVPAYVYFPVNSVFSVLVWTRDGQSTEVAAIGNEGIVGVEVVMGGTMHAETLCQLPGKAVRIRSAVLKSIWEENQDVRTAIDRYVLALLGQFTQSAACNRLHSVEQRAARWLLMSADRKGSTTFNITHEFLAAMLGANRTTVTLVLRALQQAGILQYSRSRLQIEKRVVLESLSCECYKTIREFHEAALVP
jgi:CRP-like cAMP-binding protein